MHLLIIEDSVLDYEMLVAELCLQGLAVEAVRVDNAPDLRVALARQPWDLVISDHQLPDFSSSAAFDIVSAMPERPPFIIVSGMIGEEAAVEAMRGGVDDYLIKGRLARLGMAVRNAAAAFAMRREKAEGQLRLEESQQQLSNLSARLQSLIDEERAAISREIHDDVGGTLTALRFDLELLRHELSGAQAERAARALLTLWQAAQASQRIMRNLHPPILDAGLVPALQWQVEQFRERAGVGARFRSNVQTLATGADVAMTVYRTCQEALTNIIKHSGADQVSVDLHYADGMLSMEVSDNGRGFRTEDLRKPGSLGLRGLAERTRAVNGQVDISSARGRTTLLMWLPLAPEGALDDAQSGVERAS
ncbi:MAG: response regulator [Burkholderiaceae bacterium]|nr:response regulator [Burkholderiaceae bacterium]